MELISCITPTFNRKELLERAIKSTTAQTWTNWEMVIVDDGSADGTAEMVGEYCKLDSRIRYYRNPGKGASSARNFGIGKSTGDLIVFLDDDDEHLPQRFESQARALQKSGLDFVLSGFQVKDLVTGEIIHTDRATTNGRGAGHGVRWMIRRDLLLKAGLFDEDMPSMQEVELSYRISQYGNYAYHNDIVVAGGVNHDSITKSKEKMIRGRNMLIEKQGDIMHPIELAWWYYITGIDYWTTDDLDNARRSFRRAAEIDPRKIFRAGYLVFSLTGKIKGKYFRRLAVKIVSFLAGFRLPVIVYHPIIE